MRFQERVALVTGAGSGIGRATALRFAREEGAVALCGRSLDPLLETARLCERAGGRALPLPLDVRDEAALASAFARAEAELGPVEGVVASHGVNHLARIEAIDRAVWDEIIAINLTGSFLLAREAARSMQPRRRGRIVLVSSVSGRPGFEKFPGFAAYAASKAGLTGLLEVLTVELAGSGVGAAMICPGGVDTEMFRRTFPGERAALSVEPVADAIVDLADPRTAPPSGTIIDLV